MWLVFLSVRALVTDGDNDYLALDGLGYDPMLKIQGDCITYRIATDKQQGQNVFTLQTIAPMAGQGLAAGCATNAAGFSLHAGVISNGKNTVIWLELMITSLGIIALKPHKQFRSFSVFGNFKRLICIIKVWLMRHQFTGSHIPVFCA
ncbi:MAG: hypothetical protein ACI965_001114 [Paraglaciecola sp.]